jgi:hypothetical protein
MDDSTTVVLSVVGRSPIRAWAGKVATPTLYLRCKEGSVDAYVHFGARPAVEPERDEASTMLRAC